LCRRGHITRNEIGAIRIAANETYFQVPRNVEAKFRAALKRTSIPGAEDESGITIEFSAEPPKDQPRDQPRDQARHGKDNAAQSPRGPRAPMRTGKGPPRRRD
jgi:ATP-dependent RNA helicase DeaD